MAPEHEGHPGELESFKMMAKQQIDILKRTRMEEGLFVNDEITDKAPKLVASGKRSDNLTGEFIPFEDPRAEEIFAQELMRRSKSSSK